MDGGDVFVNCVVQFLEDDNAVTLTMVKEGDMVNVSTFAADVVAEWRASQPVVMQKPYCSADGCYRTEACGPFCRDNGNLG